MRSRWQGHLYILDAASGDEIWRQRLDGRVISSPCIVGGYLWIGTATGWFYCFGP
ncbi:MAG: PQQ-like beta-propeller repeat protein [Hyphomicrobium sp.]|nr:PQQ-like beta-propeller repeat protein [Hyphomicrobium sp.]